MQIFPRKNATDFKEFSFCVLARVLYLLILTNSGCFGLYPTGLRNYVIYECACVLLFSFVIDFDLLLALDFFFLLFLHKNLQKHS